MMLSTSAAYTTGALTPRRAVGLRDHQGGAEAERQQADESCQGSLLFTSSRRHRV